ncbi:MAG: magnesium transporter CorA [Lachnospiraceae bacterium]|nr:magnesium transporter CorA [Lachnospiraceae bacterium]
MYYLIKETLMETSLEECTSGQAPYVAILSAKEWEAQKDAFTMGIDLDMTMEIDTTKAEVNYDSLTGGFSIPNRTCISGQRKEFIFALDEKGVVFIDESGFAQHAVEEIIKNRKWRFPSLERFLYDFLEQVVYNDLKMLEAYESRLEKLEDDILNDNYKDVIESLNDIRGDLLDLRTHYEQMIDLGQELEENENHFFAEKNLRYFRLITGRIERYRDQILALREYSMQIRDLYQTHIDVRQNKTMTVLTVITTIFFPLSIITGWYGMNFAYMPELEYKWSYPILFGVCVLVIITGLIIAKKKKWW